MKVRSVKDTVSFCAYDQLAEAFGLEKERYVPVMILSIGKALVEGYNSIRLDAKELTTFK